LTHPSFLLLPEAEFLDDVLVPLHIGFPQIVKKPPPLADQFEKPSARMMVLLVDLEVIREIVDSIAQDGNLNFRGTRILLMKPETINNLSLGIWTQNHVYPSF
jgi:hypothetical protein